MVSLVENGQPVKVFNINNHCIEGFLVLSVINFKRAASSKKINSGQLLKLSYSNVIIQKSFYLPRDGTDKMVETTLDSVKTRYTVWITEAEKRKVWKALKRKTPVAVEFLYKQESSPITGIYQVWLRLDTGERSRLPIRACYRYEYVGKTAYGAPFILTFGHDLFDFRETLFVTPPANPMDWAVTFS